MAGSDASDDDLVRRARAGESGAFGELASRHEARVYRVCLRMLGNPEDAWDASQDAFVSALRKLGQFRGDAAFTTWMHRIAVNACYDIMRRDRRQPLLRLADADHERDDEFGPPVPDHADAVAGSRDVAAALAAVPEDFRAALVLADVEDLPYDEIAAILGVAVGTVKSLVHRGRLALAKALGLDREPGAASHASQEQA